MADIFISYTSSDRDWAHWIAGELATLGHTPHIHEWEIGAGDDIYAWMEKRHDAADHVLCVVSDEYLKAPYSTLERNAATWQAASKRPGFVIFVVVKPCRLPTLTDHIRRCELFGIDRDEARKRFADFMATRAAPKGGFVFPGQVYALSNIPVRVPEHFLGRDDALDAIDEGLSRFKGRVAITALHGLRGVGKTTLAAAYADRKRAEYRATWWVRAQTPEGMRADLVALGVRLGWVPADAREDPALAQVLERLANEGEGILLIYDNALDAPSLRPFLPKGGAAHALVTSNFHAWRGLAAPVEIRLWPKNIGADYFVARTGRDDERDAAETLSDALGGLPLAHEQAAAYCERLSVSFADYLKRLSAQPARLLDDTRHAPADYHDGLTVAKTFALAIAEASRLHPAAAPLLAHAAILPPEPIPLFLFAEGREQLDEPLKTLIAGDGLDEALAALATFALVERETVEDERQPEITTDCFHLHRLIRQVADAPEGRPARAKALVRALAQTYPADAFDEPGTWPRCRRLHASAMALAQDGTLDISGVETVMADLLDAVGKFDYRVLAVHGTTRTLLERALAIREEFLGPEHPATATSLNTLAVLMLRAMGDLAGARAMLERALAIREKMLGPDHRHTAASIGNLATVMMDMGDLPAARTLYERALERQERNVGPDHPDTSTLVNNLAGLLHVMGDHAAARPLYDRALALREKILGPEHPGTAMTLANMARMEHVVGDFADSRRHFERALAICEKVLGPEHPQTAVTLNNLGSLLGDLGERDAARAMFERALAIDEKIYGHDSVPTTLGLSNLGRLLADIGEYDVARPLLERALEVREKVLGRDHADVATALNNLGDLFEAMGDLAHARPLYERGVALLAAAVGDGHVNTNRMRYNLAGVLLAEGRAAQALPLAETAFAGHMRALGARHVFTQGSARVLADTLAALGRQDEAEAIREKSSATALS